MIGDERLEELAQEDDLYNYPPTQQELNGMAKELLALRKILALPAELPCNVTVGATTFREGVKTINLLKAIHRRSLNP